MILYLNVVDSLPVERSIVLHCDTCDITVVASVKERTLTISSSDSSRGVVVVDMMSRSGTLGVTGNRLVVDAVVIFEDIGSLHSIDLPEFDPSLINFVEAV